MPHSVSFSRLRDGKASLFDEPLIHERRKKKKWLLTFAVALAVAATLSVGNNSRIPLFDCMKLINHDAALVVSLRKSKVTTPSTNQPKNADGYSNGYAQQCPCCRCTAM